MSGSFFRLVALNAWRHRLRSGLTVLGMVVAILAFGLLGTVVDAWYAGANGAAANRLITRSSISLVFPLPLTYKDRIRAVDGVRDLSWANWFGGIYKEPKNFFPQFAVDGESYFRIYPEFIVDERQMRDFLRDRKGCIVGRKLADTHGFKVGDTLTLKGTIYAGNWDFVIRGIYDGASKSTDRSQMFFHWAYLNETVKARLPGRADNVGVFIVEVDSADRVATVSRSIDREFVNSRAETLTETEKAFALGFVAMTEAIVVAIRIVSYLVIFIIMAVMANTMSMTARERTAEYATLKALGFSPGFVAALICGESLMLALVGGLVGILLTFPVAAAFAAKMGTLFPVFNVSQSTVLLQVGCALAVGIVAALLPMRRVARLSIVDGLRAVA
ncbi:FtsX-like permease family protein [Zoogloea sp.]|uniref:ABC transporter permease n=1 Tax=Zoogloea sp. TaxID=49181 RepID=UPI002BD8C54F|nr:FtsX-like permease family protein [Zoogloea sp.]HQA09054.1 ABC transporter permease [Zoogloea sp.]HQE38264.1 ABC transporter permease [Zoogloea sp.]